MIQIIPNNKRSFTEEVLGGLNEAMPGLQDYFNKQQQQQQAQQRSQQLQKLTGMDLSGLPPDMQEKIVVEQLKQMGKQRDLKTKQDFANRLLVPEDQEERPISAPGIMSPEYMEGKNNQRDNGGFKPGKIKPNDLLALSTVDPQTAKLVQSMQDIAQRQETEKEKLDYSKEKDKKSDISKSFKENEKYINKVYDSYEDAERKEALLDRMDQLEESGELSDSGIINLLEGVGLKPEWLQNPANEEYTKLGLDTLGGGTLQADYGSRVLASEFKVSLQRIPTLSQTPEGRKQIKENIRAMLLPAKLKKERMQYYIEKAKRTGEPLPHDLRGQVLKDIKPQLDEAYDAFKQRNGRYKVREGTEPDDTSLEKYYFLSNGSEKVARKMMREDGYDVDF